MDKEELKEVMRLLKEAGIDAQLCDTPVPVSANPARCGWPEDLEDECIDDYILLPKAVVGQYPEMFIPAIGDSMIEAGYEEGVSVSAIASSLVCWPVSIYRVAGLCIS